jgi:hypothetical protein
MKKNLNIAILILAIVTGSIARSQPQNVYDEGYIVKVGDMAPDFTISEAGGKTYRLSSLR